MSQTQEKTLFRLEIDKHELTSDNSVTTEESSTSLEAVEFEILPPIDFSDKRKVEIYKGISDIDERLDIVYARVDELNSQIDSLTNHADGLDYAVAVASGIITGFLDSFLVGESNPNIEETIKKFAKRKGCPDNIDPQEFLESKYKTPNDGAYKKGTDIFGRKIEVGGATHRLDDLAHHPTLLGLVASIMVRFFRVGLFVNNKGEWHPVAVETNPKDILKAWGPIALSGLLIWLADVTEKHCDDIDADIPVPIHQVVKLLADAPAAIEILRCADTWIGHIMSDVGTPAGIPGIFLSFLKEISNLPILRNTGLPKLIQGLYTSKQMSFAKEAAVLDQLGKQAMPVILNEVIVRGLYFVRHLISEIKQAESLANVDWSKTLPFNNRTIVRMLTIATGTFTAFDVADAAIRSGGFNAACILRINFVGVGRFAIAIGTDISMGIKKSKKETERIKLKGEQLELLNAKLFYKEADMWIEAENTDKAIQEVYVIMDKAANEFSDTWNEFVEGSENRMQYVEKIRTNNKEFADELADLLEWGI